MKTSYFLPLLLVCALPSFSARAMDLKESKFTEVVDDVKVISAADKTVTPAALNEVFKMPDVLRTGPDSRAELVAEDQTVTRVGANTIFSFDPASRTVDLKQGSLLFHSPHGKGGGTIQTGSATASVLGTTIIVSTTPNGGFKVLVLEGHAAVQLSGVIQHLNAGQMIYVLPGGGISPIVVFRLDEETKGSKLVGGFKKPLASLGLINKAIGGQLKQIKNGRAVDTGLLAGDTATSGTIEAIPAATIQALDNQPTTPQLSDADAALQTDFIINTPTLDINNIFSDFNITIDPNGFLGGGDLPNPFSGFPGHNITVNTPTVDLSPYAGQGQLDIVALNNLTVQSSVTFNGLLSSDQLYLAAGNQLSIASGSSVEADCDLFWVGGFQPITLSSVGLVNNLGELELLSLSALTLQNGSSISAGGQAYLSGSTVTIGDSTITGGTGGTVSTGVNIKSTVGAITIDNGSSITASSSTLKAEANTAMTLDNVTLANSANWGMNLSADNGILSLNQATLNVDGDGILYGSGGVTIGNSTINPNGADAIGIESGDSITINNNSDITANDTLYVSANSDLTVDTAMLAGGLYVTTTLDGNSSVTIGNSSVEGGFVEVNSSDGAININNNSTVKSDTGSINIEAYSDATIDTATLNSYGDITLSADNGDLLLNGATLTGGFYNSSTLSGYNSVTIDNSSVASGSLGITSGNGTVDINNHSTVTSDTGNINVEAYSDAAVDTAALHSFGTLTLSADNGGLTLNGATLTSGGHAGLSGNTTVNIGNSSITAGDVDIEAASGAMTVNNSSSITASSGDIIMNAHADLTVDNATLTGNNNNNVALTSANNDLSLNNDAISSVVTATLSGKTSVTFGGGSLNANAASFQSANGSISISSGATIAANTITLTAGDGILINNVTMAGSLPSTPGTLTATAANTITFGSLTHTVDISGLASISMTASTFNFYGVIFGGSGVYNFDCASGLAAVNPGSSMPGEANFFNCFIDSTAITSVGQIDVTTSSSAAPGIHVF